MHQHTNTPAPPPLSRHAGSNPGQLIKETSTGASNQCTFMLSFPGASNQCICHKMAGTVASLVLSSQCVSTSTMFCGFIYNSRAQYQVRGR